MCTPMLAIGAGLQAASSVVKFAGEQAATDAYNAQAAAAHRDASLAAQYKYEQEGLKYSYDARANNREAYRQTMKGREAIGTSQASAGSSGVDGGSISLTDIISKQKQDMAAAASDSRAKRADLKDSYTNNTRGYEAEAQGRINATPFKEGPSLLGLAIDIAGTGLGAAQKGGMFGS